eukprot:NODE_6635_length_616_cov_17.668430_g5664_i0.p3 GENE.NODE_6635_length_616_cov_17.668430_g5664_i0~~NODE_6635_length_616_cov_17.668430_g5664_i0.p3  ORF type:complete len:108 (-),score=29.19 NODE_6635_length_616_cov_17.668430_g5664_i0:94-417(-)
MPLAKDVELQPAWGRLAKRLNDSAQGGTSASTAWSSLADILHPSQTVVAEGQKVGKLDCALKAVELAPNASTAWNNLANSLHPSQKVVVEGQKGRGEADDFDFWRRR